MNVKKAIVMLLSAGITLFNFLWVDTSDSYAGYAKYSETVAYINHFPIQSYHFCGYTFIKAEDLSHYGFDVRYNDENKTLCIFRNQKKNKIDETLVYKAKPENAGKDWFPVFKNGVSTYIRDFEYPIECFGGIPGYTLINIDNLSAFGKVEWVPQDNAMKVWIEDGLEMSYAMQPVMTDPYPIHSTVWCEALSQYSCNEIGTDDMLGIFFGLTNDSHTVFSKCSGAMKIEIYDSCGSERYQKTHFLYETDFNTLAYGQGLMELPLSAMVLIDKSAMLPSVDGNGTIRVTFQCKYSHTPVCFTLKAHDLPH